MYSLNGNAKEFDLMAESVFVSNTHFEQMICCLMHPNDPSTQQGHESLAVTVS